MSLGEKVEERMSIRTTMNANKQRTSRHRRSNSSSTIRTVSSMTSFLVLVVFFVGAILMVAVNNSNENNSNSVLQLQRPQLRKVVESNEQQQQQQRDLCACVFMDGEFRCPDCSGRKRFGNRDHLVESTNVDPVEDTSQVEMQQDLDKLQHDVQEELKLQQEPGVEEVVVVVPFPTDEQEQPVEVPEQPDEQLSDTMGDTMDTYPGEDERDYFKTSWPELLGVPGAKAREIILAENPALAEVWLVPFDVEGQMTFTADYRPDRVHITVDDSVDLLVLETPTVG